MTGTTIGKAQLVEEYNELVIGQNDLIANGTFSRNTNFWTVQSGAFFYIVNGGVKYIGDNNVYQKITNVVSGTKYIARVHIESITGVVTMNLGTTVGGSELGSKVLSEGWNNIQITSGVDSYISIIGSLASANCVINRIECREVVDICFSGNVFIGGNGSSGFPLNNNWRIRPENNVLLFEYSTDNFVTSIVANAIVAE